MGTLSIRSHFVGGQPLVIVLQCSCIVGEIFDIIIRSTPVSQEMIQFCG